MKQWSGQSSRNTDLKMGKTGTESPTRPKNRVAITFENDPVAPERIVMPTPPRERVSDMCSCSSKLLCLSVFCDSMQNYSTHMVCG